jgi:hypothetical protein
VGKARATREGGGNSQSLRHCFGGAYVNPGDVGLVKGRGRLGSRRRQCKGSMIVVVGKKWELSR